MDAQSGLMTIEQAALRQLGPSGGVEWLLNFISWGKRRSRAMDQALKDQRALFENDILIMLDLSCQFMDSSSRPDAQEREAQIAIAGSSFLGFATRFAGIEALKRAAARVWIDAPMAMEPLHWSSGSISLEESLCARLEQESMAIQASGRGRFTVEEAITGAVADTLNLFMDGDAYQARLAQRAQEELALLIPSPPPLDGARRSAWI